MKTTFRSLSYLLIFVAAVALLLGAATSEMPTSGKFLVLRNGQTMEGDIERVDGQYRVRRNGAETWVPANLVLRLFLDTEGRFIGPGQLSILTDDGTDFFGYHYYDGNANGTSKLNLRALRWTADGWPVAGAAFPVPEPSSIVLAAMAERLPAVIAAHLAAVLDAKIVAAERDGVSQRLPARIGVIALDEGIAPYPG